MSSIVYLGVDHFKVEDFWANCPNDILLYIFQYLDIKSLINCMLVNKLWQDIVDYHCQHCRLWQKMVEDGIPNKGISFKEKSLIEWRDIIYNFIFWYNVKNATIKIYCTLEIGRMKSVKVHKDNVIIVCKDNIKHFNTNNLKLTRTIDITCLTFQESDFLIVTHTLSEPRITSFNSLTLKNKLHLDNCECETKIITVFDICTYKLQSNSCYVLDNKNVLWLYESKHCMWDIKVLAKYYGNSSSIRNLHIYDNHVYIILKTGNILHVDKERRLFENVCHIEVPLYLFDAISYPIHTCSILFGANSEKYFESFPQKQKGQLVLAIPGLTCVTEHGDVLFLGYEDGKIQICIISKMQQSETVVPEVEFYLRNFTDITETKAITAIDVFEDYGEHHLYVATDCDLYHIIIN